MSNTVHLLPHDEWSLGQAKAYLRRKVDDGATCPCCNQFAKVYKRKLYATMARTLIYAWRNFGQQYFHLSQLDGKQPGVRQADFPKLSYWGVIEKHPSKPEWRITGRGRMFLANTQTLQQTVVLYDSRLMRFEGPEVGIVKVLGTKFSYQELMYG